MGHLQIVILTLRVAIQCAGLFYVSMVWVGERDLVTILASTMSLLMHISIVMDMLQFMYLILVLLHLVVAESHADVDLLSFFLFTRCVEMGGLCGVLRMQFYLLLSDLVTDYNLKMAHMQGRNM